MLAVRQCTFVELKVLVTIIYIYIYSYLHLPTTRHQKEKTVIVFSILEHLLNKGVRFLRNPTLHINDVNIWRVGDSRHRSYSNRYEEIHLAKDTKNRPLPRLQHVDASSYLILVIFQWQPFSNPLEHGVFVSSARFVSPFNAIPLTCIPNYMST